MRGIDFEAKFKGRVQQLNPRTELLAKVSFDNIGMRMLAWLLTKDKNPDTSLKQYVQYVTLLFTFRGLNGSDSSPNSSTVDEVMKLDDTAHSTLNEALLKMTPNDFAEPSDSAYVTLANFAEQYAGNAISWLLEMNAEHGLQWCSDRGVVEGLKDNGTSMAHLLKDQHGSAAASGSAAAYFNDLPDSDVDSDGEDETPPSVESQDETFGFRTASLAYENAEYKSDMGPGIKGNLNSSSCVKLVHDVAIECRSVLPEKAKAAEEEAAGGTDATHLGPDTPAVLQAVLQEEVPTVVASDMSPIEKMIADVLSGKHTERQLRLMYSAGIFHSAKRSMVAAGHLFDPLMTCLLNVCERSEVQQPYIKFPSDPDQCSWWWSAFIMAADIVKTIRYCDANSIQPNDTFSVRQRDEWVLSRIKTCANSYILHWLHRDAVSFFAMLGAAGHAKLSRRERYALCRDMEQIQALHHAADHGTGYVKWAIWNNVRWRMHSPRWKAWMAETGWIATAALGKDELEDLHVEHAQGTVRSGSNPGQMDMHMSDRGMQHHFANTTAAAELRQETRRRPKDGSQKEYCPVTRDVAKMVQWMMDRGHFADNMRDVDNNPIQSSSCACATGGGDMNPALFTALGDSGKALGQYAQSLFKDWAHHDNGVPGVNTLFKRQPFYSSVVAVMRQEHRDSFTLTTVADIAAAKYTGGKRIFTKDVLVQCLQQRKASAAAGTKAAAVPDSGVSKGQKLKNDELMKLLSEVRTVDGVIEPPAESDSGGQFPEDGLPAHRMLWAAANTDGGDVQFTWAQPAANPDQLNPGQRDLPVELKFMTAEQLNAGEPLHLVNMNSVAIVDADPRQA